MSGSMGREGSHLLVEEYLAAGDPRLLDELRTVASPRYAQGLAERLFRDRRAAVRSVLLAYVDDGCDRRGHRPLVKRLLWQAEAAGDDEMMAHLMVAFDRLARRCLVERAHYDWVEQTVRTETCLVLDPTLPRTKLDATTTGRFSRRTRMYLQRRALRYFRRLGFRDPVRYRAALVRTLLLYRDEHLDKPESLLDAWGLLHILYGRSPVLVRRPGGIILAPERRLAELAPAPLHPTVWQGCRDDVLALLRAPSRTVRVWAIALLDRDYADALAGATPAQLLPLLRSEFPEVQSFAVKLLERASGLSTLPIADWLDLLRMNNLVALPTVVELVKKHVHPDRLSIDQCIELACLPASPVAELGLAWLRARWAAAGGAPGALVRLANAPAPTVRATATTWLAELLATAAARPEDVRSLIDARYADVRQQGLRVLSDVQRFREDETLWAALAESPHAEVRSALVAVLERHEKGLTTESRRRLWATTLLDVRRAGKIKPTVLSQITSRLVKAPDETTSLLALVRTILRSVRPRERNHALVALARAAARRPELVAAIHAQIPEVKLLDVEVA